MANLRGVCLLVCAQWACAQVDTRHWDEADHYGSQVQHYEGTWVGYVQDYAFEDGSGQVIVQIDAAGQGAIRFGTRELQTDGAQLVRELLATNESVAEDEVALMGLLDGVQGGFEYHFTATVVDSGRLQFVGWGGEVLQPWCDSLSPHKVPPTYVGAADDYVCLPFGVHYIRSDEGCSLVAAADELTAVSCDELLCFFVCDCDEAACWTHGYPEFLSGAPRSDFGFEGAMLGPGDVLEGELRLGETLVDVHLERQ